MIQRLRFIFPKTDNFREERPLICWEHMYGWLDGYGILFDPLVQSATGVIPQWENGWNGQSEEGDFFITTCQQASKYFTDQNCPGIYIRPENQDKIAERLSEKEQLITPVGEFCYPSHLPFDYYAVGKNGWKLGEAAGLIRKGKSLAVGFEFFAMLWSWGGDWPEKRFIAGADIFAAILAELGYSAGSYSKDLEDLRIDFQSYGINRLFVQWLIEINGGDKSGVKDADAAYLEGIAGWRNANSAEGREKLGKAFLILAEIRKRISKLEIFFLEYPHMGILFEDKGFFELEWPQYSRETMLSYLENVEVRGYRVSMEAGASCWKNLSRRFPSLIADIGKAWGEQKIELTNGTFSLPYALLSPLGLQYWQFEHGGKIFQEVFGMKPDTYQCQENSLTPQMPELLKHFGYRRALHITQNHGQAPGEETDFIRWSSPAGHAIPAMSARNVALSKKGINYFLDLPLIHTEFKNDGKPLNYVNFQDIGYVPFRVHMIRAHRYADVWGRFCLAGERFDAAYIEAEAPVKTYFADAYKISASAFYRDATNSNALSQYETIFRLWGRFRKLRFAASYSGKLEQLQERFNTLVPSLCLLEAHDASIVQGQRRGEFYAPHKTIITPPYSRETLSAKVAEIAGDIIQKLEGLEKEIGGTACWFNASEIILPFAKTDSGYVRNIPAMGTVPACMYADKRSELALPLEKGCWRLELDEDGAISISYKDTHVRCLPVDRRRGYFKPVKTEAFEKGDMNFLRISYLREDSEIQIAMLELVFTEDNPFIEINIGYSPRNNFDPSDKWSDYLALETDFGRPLKKVYRFNPNVRSVSSENRIASPYYLSLETADSRKACLINEGSFLYELDRVGGNVNWLFHVACETVCKRRIGLVFDTDDAFLLSRAWSQGVLGTKLAASSNPLIKVSTWKDISIEDFISPDTLLVSNLKDSANEFHTDVISSAQNMCGENILTSSGIRLKPFELAQIIFK